MRCRALLYFLLTSLTCFATGAPIQVPRTNYAGTAEPAVLYEMAVVPPQIAGIGVAVRSSELPNAPDDQRFLRYRPRPPAVVSHRFRALSEDKEDGSDPGDNSFTVNGANVAFMRRAYLRLAPRGVDGEISVSLGAQYATIPEGYHWRGLFAQSFLFSAVESSVRIASDSQIRTLLFHKPFWHDYVASLGQFNMRRWNDGDSFVVNYVGHPMQGAISGYIEIQNDPKGRDLQISATSAYWKSRWKAFLWATAFSIHSEISPLGEAGIGNEGGWTYPLDCPAPCDTSKVHQYTNNTGWVDFIITPTVGMLWIFAEDTLDRYVSDRVAGGDRSRWTNRIIRSTLNPGRSAANLARGKVTWYRDFEHGAELRRRGSGIRMLPSDEEAAEARRFRKYEIAAHFRAMPLGSSGDSCVVCLGGAGGGFEFTYGLNRWLRASAALDKQQGTTQKGSSASGSTLSAGFGVRFEHNGLRHNVSLALRPGLVMESVTLPNETSKSQDPYAPEQHDSVVHAAATFMLSSDYKFSPTVAFRSSIGNTVVRYRSPVEDPPGIGHPPSLSWLSHDNFVNRSHWICEVGPVFRF